MSDTCDLQQTLLKKQSRRKLASYFGPPGHLNHDSKRTCYASKVPLKYAIHPHSSFNVKRKLPMKGLLTVFENHSFRNLHSRFGYTFLDWNYVQTQQTNEGIIDSDDCFPSSDGLGLCCTDWTSRSAWDAADLHHT